MIETERLILRPWQDRDRVPFAAMGQDALVMRYLGPLQSRTETDAAIDRMIELQVALNHCFWAIERRVDAAFLGFCGLKPGPDRTPIAGGIEIGWRLASAHWRQGYAREAAQASLEWGWENLIDTAILAMTVAANAASWGLMDRLGMYRQPALDFDHPGVPEGSPLRRHMIYRIDRPANRHFINQKA
ncbi:GNAT family N-acetyltransferase [Sphingomonas sp. 28-63-12]|uniref:GNAT family N-acetyltransferase n=1 Tax=Sphingomonas sp. 28-63-12 TaxID=1970434 RepID=UPI000BD0446E|nr:MAG: GNAT family N-acetyltransferase [Sphingomonas sp. 28-63-12]